MLCCCPYSTVLSPRGFWVQVESLNAEQLEVALAERDRPLVIDFSANCELTSTFLSTYACCTTLRLRSASSISQGLMEGHLRRVWAVPSASSGA